MQTEGGRPRCYLLPLLTATIRRPRSKFTFSLSTPTWKHKAENLCFRGGLDRRTELPHKDKGGGRAMEAAVVL